MSRMSGPTISVKTLLQRGDDALGVVDAQRGLGDVGDRGVGPAASAPRHRRRSAPACTGPPNLAHGALDLGMAGMADQDQRCGPCDIALALVVDLGDQRAGGVQHRQAARSWAAPPPLGDAMGAEHGDGAFGTSSSSSTKIAPLFFRLSTTCFVVHDLVAHIDRRRRTSRARARRSRCGFGHRRPFRRRPRRRRADHALHYVFDTPRDRLIWDVGHQAYPHKILTGRRDRIRTLRTGGGLSGFTKRTESDYDPFGAAHSSTSISAGLGMAVARDLSGGKNNVIAVIGDGAMSAGMAYEAMNNAGAMNSRLIVILNDNDMSIAPPVGAMSAYLSRLFGQDLSHAARSRQAARQAHLPKVLANRANRVEEYSRGFMVGRRHAVRGARLLLCRPDRRPQSRPSAAGAEERPRHADRPDPGPCRDPEGQGLRPGGSFRRQVSRRGQVRRRHRRPGQGQAECAVLPERVRPEPGQGSREGRQDRRHHRGDAVGHRHRHLRQGLSPTAPSMSASPSSMR
jgi:hypothetical protein